MLPYVKKLYTNKRYKEIIITNYHFETVFTIHVKGIVIRGGNYECCTIFLFQVTHLFRLSEERATIGEVNVRVERNLCVALGCIAEKLVGPNSVAILTNNTLEYLLAFLVSLLVSYKFIVISYRDIRL